MNMHRYDFRWRSLGSQPYQKMQWGIYRAFYGERLNKTPPRRGRTVILHYSIQVHCRSMGHGGSARFIYIELMKWQLPKLRLEGDYLLFAIIRHNSGLKFIFQSTWSDMSKPPPGSIQHLESRLHCNETVVMFSSLRSPEVSQRRK